MKKRNSITHTLRDKWIENWRRENQRSNHYVSFIKTQDLKSLGAKSRTPDYEKLGQDRNLLSTNERFFFLRLLFDKQITVIKEQYPLLPIERAMAVATELDVKYPTYPYSANVPVVMTCDFYCETIFGTKVVYSIKDDRATSKEVSKKKLNNLENKLKIDKLFWATQGVEWKLILSSSIKNTFTTNLEKLAPFIIINSKLTFLLPLWLIEFAANLKQSNEDSLSSLLMKTSQLMSLKYDEVIALFQHAVWHRLVLIDLYQPLFYEKAVSSFEVQVAEHD